MRKIILILFLSTSSILFAQGGSNYSIFGFGDLTNGSRSGYEALGGTQIAMPDPYGINLKNPSMWTNVQNTRLSLGYRFNQHINVDENATLLQNNGKITGFHGMFKVDTLNDVAAAIGIYPYTSRDFLIQSPISITENDLTTTGNVIYSGEGGINEAYAGLSFRFLKDFAFGGMIFTNFGNLSTETNTLINGDFSYFNSYVIKNEFLSGAGTRIGIAYRGINNLQVGAYYETFWNTSVESERRYFTIRGGVDDTTLTSTFDVTMPTAYGFGASYMAGKFIIGADFEMRQFADFDYNQRETVTYRDNMRISLGVNRIGNFRYTAPILDRIDYKFGVFYNELYFNVAGEDINEYGASFGGRIPFGNSMYSDAAFVFGSRGTTNSGLIQEYYLRFIVDVSIGETWFKPFRREY